MAIISHSIETLTPETALKWLESSVYNRSLSTTKVAQYRSDIENDNWKLNGQPIVFDYNGHLMQGHHRCQAVVVANKAIRVTVVRGVDPLTRATQDTGKSWTVGDHLSAHQYNNSTKVSAAINHYFRIVENIPNSKLGRTAEQAIGFLQENPHFEESLKVGEKLKELIPPSAGGAVHYYITQRSEGMAETFFQEFIDGTGLEIDMPVHTLRRWLGKESNRKKRVEEKIAVVLRAWIAYRNDWSLSKLTGLTDAGNYPEL